jgi:hypothetical protein
MFLAGSLAVCRLFAVCCILQVTPQKKNNKFKSGKLWGVLNILCVFYLLVRKSVLKIGPGNMIVMWGALSC